MRVATILMPLLLLAAPALADEVHLTTGRSLQGRVIEETPEHVVIKTPKGKVTLPRRLVKSITKQDKAHTWLALGRERLRAGSLDEATKLYRKAAKSADAEVARKARAGLAEVEAARARRAEAKAKLRVRPKPVAAPGAKSAEPTTPSQAPKRVVWGYDEVRAALRKGDARQAQVLLKPLLAARKADPVLQYLSGRAQMALGGTRGAYGAYREVVNTYLARRKLSPIYLPPVAERLEDLARRSFGEALRPGLPGVDDEWKRVEIGTRFAVYHKMDFHQPGWGTPYLNGFNHFKGHLKAAHEAVSKALGVDEERLGGRRAPRVIVFLYPSSNAHAAAGGSGHARHREVPDGWLHILDCFQILAVAPPAPGARRRNASPIDALKHKVAHTILRDAFALPAWSEEAIASYLASPGNADRAELLRVAAEAKLPPARDFLTHKVQPTKDATTFDAQGLLILRALIELRGGDLKQAVALCEAIRARGAEQALADVRLSFRRVEGVCRRLRIRKRR